MATTRDRPHVLYVDADEFKVDHFRRSFRTTYHCLTATSAAEADALLAAHPVQVVVVDDKLDLGSGLDYLERLAAERPQPLRIIVAPPQRNKPVLTAIHAGHVFYSVVKPWDVEELQLAIESSLQAYRNARAREAIERHLEELVAARTEQLEAKTHSLEHAMEQIHDSITYARKIQYALLPELSSIRKSLPKSFIFYQPRDIVSGDFYWFFAARRQVMLAVVDCTGHGVPSAFMSILGLNNLNQIIREHGLISPGQVLSELNDRICTTLKQGFTSSDGVVPPLDGMDLGLVSIDLDKRTVQFAGAGRPLVYTHKGQQHYLKGSTRPIGGTSQLDRQSYETHSVQLEAGDRIWLYTDGISDQFGGPRGMKLTGKRWVERLEALGTVPFDDLQGRVGQLYHDWRGTQRQTDDVLVVGLEL